MQKALGEIKPTLGIGELPPPPSLSHWAIFYVMYPPRDKTVGPCCKCYIPEYQKELQLPAPVPTPLGSKNFGCYRLLRPMNYYCSPRWTTHFYP